MSEMHQIVKVHDKLPFSYLLCESNRYIWDQYHKLGLKRDCHQLAEYQPNLKNKISNFLW